MVVGNVEVFSGRRRCLSCFLLGQRKFFFGQCIQQGLYRCVVLSRKSDFYVPVFLRKLSEMLWASIWGRSRSKSGCVTVASRLGKVWTLFTIGFFS